MENYQGDLADIIRPGGGPTSGTLANTTTSSSGGTTESWQFQSSDDFSHPFLLEELDMSAGSSFFNTSNSIEATNSVNNNNYYINHQQLEIRRSPSNNIFSRMIIDSPITSPRVLEAPCPTLISANDRMISANSSKAASCLMENTGIQISSPQNTGIKRRKGRAKRVVCIPAPAPANSRSAGEIVPSDLWAWRKYGQKPIKGSPYPRGYYRCSSSKGCSARKQVERSRSEPNMLVITYTSEHNHPWPTQRNALAGSTRTQPAKNNHPAASNNSSPITVHTPSRKEIPNIENVSSTSIDDFTGNSTFVKEEEIMEDGDELSKGFPPYDQIYRSALPESNNSDQDFFAGLGEIEGDPLNLLFYQGFLSEEVGRENINKDSDLFTVYDWAGNNNNT